MSNSNPRPESHWYSSSPEDQPPHDQVVSVRALVCEARGRLGPGATRKEVLADLKGRGLDVNSADLSRVWDELG